MTILNFGLYDATLLDAPESMYAYPNYPAWSPSTTYAGYITAPVDTFYQDPYANGDKGYLHGGYFYPIIAAIDWAGKPTNKEFWFSFLWRSPTAPIADDYMFNTGTLVQFLNWDGSRWKVTADIIINSTSNLIYRVYTDTEGSNTITNTQLVSNNKFYAYSVDPTTKLCRLDIRVLLDSIAGFVQMYNYTATKTDEFLGRTCNTMMPTHLAINLYKGATSEFSNKQLIDNFLPVSCIVADESTLGMYVVPLMPKAAGASQEQTAGSVASIAGQKLFPATLGSVAITANVGETKKFSVKLKDMVDVALPANYVVKAAKVSAIFDAISSKGDPLSVNINLRKVSTSTELPIGVKSVRPNVISTSTKIYQRAHVLMQQNPITAANWTVADFADIEVGFSFTGS